MNYLTTIEMSKKWGITGLDDILILLLKFSHGPRGAFYFENYPA